MINLFGKWVNPANICYIEDAAHSVIIYFNGASLEIRGKTAEDVAQELDRLLMLPLVDSVRLASIPMEAKAKKK